MVQPGSSPAAANPLETVPIEKIQHSGRYKSADYKEVIRKVLVELRAGNQVELYDRYLSPFQWSEMERTGWIPVRGSKGHMYFVCALYGFAIYQIENSRGYTYCFHVGSGDYLDCAIATVLLIRADEGRFRAVANRQSCY
jgi:hypothetical protein